MLEKIEAQVIEDFGGVIKLYSDGSVVRGDDSAFSSILPEPDTFNFKHVEYKDVVMDEEIGLWARLYFPPETTSKAPILLYYHGGGFCIFSPATPVVHRACQMWAATLGALIVSVDYSAGGNIAYHVGLWAAGAKAEIEINGLILVYPYFGGEEHTSSEKESSSVFSLEQSDVLWRLVLPVGSNRDHPFSNPLIEEAVVSAAADIPPMLFVIAGRDILSDR
ncbi:hypothetical protein SUGI_0986970 [Cryptomeria japonica]|nr:hypothetical protein SUGI_0986970 [Cryptomeria japonica]